MAGHYELSFIKYVTIYSISQIITQVKNYLKIINIGEDSITPKYLQLANSILAAIEQGKISKGDLLPSLNDLWIALDIYQNYYSMSIQSA